MTNIFFLPDGTRNLGKLFPIDWTQVESYRVQAQDATGETIASTPNIQVDTCIERGVRIHFVNYLNCIDAINFHIVSAEHDTKSESYQQPDVYPQDKTRHSIGRMNISTTDSFSIYTIDYPEDALDWLNELADTPFAWLEWFGVQGQQDSYLPIVISDIKNQVRKEDNRFEYQINIDFIMSNARKPLRG
jgi:hypothetical protein